MTEHAGQGFRKEFKVRIDVQLPTEAFDRIERAIQRAVLAELADVDVASGYSVALRDPNAGDDEPREDATDGIWITPERPL